MNIYSIESFIVFQNQKNNPFSIYLTFFENFSPIFKYPSSIFDRFFQISFEKKVYILEDMSIFRFNFTDFQKKNSSAWETAKGNNWLESVQGCTRAAIKQTRCKPGIIQNGGGAAGNRGSSNVINIHRSRMHIATVLCTRVHACRMKARRVRTRNNNVYKERYGAYRSR